MNPILALWLCAVSAGSAVLPDTPADAVVRTDGAIKRVQTAGAWSLAWGTNAFQTWVYGVNDSPTWHLEPFPAPPAPGRAIQTRQRLDTPFAWAVKWDPKAGRGAWFMADRRAHIEQTGEAVTLAFEPGSAVAMAEVSAPADGFRVALQAVDPIVWNGATGTWHNLTIVKGAPERWDVYCGERRTMRFVFQPGVCLIACDLNQNGELDDAEAGHPACRLRDLNGDGRFFEGFILQGGRLEQDACDLAPDGSPDGQLWSRRVTAYDLDGDGDQDATERLSLLDYHDRGDGSDSADGLMIDYGDRPAADVLQIDAAGSSVRLWPIARDAYWFAGYAGAAHARYVDADRVWRLDDEQVAVGDDAGAPGQIVTQAGGIRRIALAGTDPAAPWQVAVACSSGANGLMPGPVTRWRTPWGQELRTASWLAPQYWDGTRRTNSAAWNWAVTQAWASVATIATDAGGAAPAGREEVSSAGATTCAFYRSPLVGGLHHKGAHHGRSSDGRLLYADRDGDGIVDVYAWDEAGDHRYRRRLWYDRAAHVVTMMDREAIRSWEPGRLEFPEVRLLPAEAARFDALIRTGGPGLALLPAPPDARPANLRAVNVAVDGLWSDVHSDDGVAALGRALAFSPVRLQSVDHPLTADGIAGVNVLILRWVEGAERKLLRRWVEGGGTLVLALRHADWRVPGGRFTDPPVAADFRVLRVSETAGDALAPAADKYPTAANRIEHFSGRVPWLAGLSYLAADGPGVEADEPLLRYDGRMLAGRTRLGEGQVILVGGGLLANRFDQPARYRYLLRPDEPHMDNFWLAQRILCEAAGCLPLPAPVRQKDSVARPPVINVPWTGTRAESDVVRIEVYPELGGRLLWLGRADTGANALRVEEPWYLMGRPTDLGPFAPFRNYGGLFDVGAPGWPGLHLFDQTYAVDRQSQPRGEQVTVSGAADGVAVRRETLLPRGQAAAVFQIVQRNATERSRRMMVRLETEFRAGPRGVDLYWPNGTAIETLAYAMGREAGTGFKPFSGGWLAAVDRSSGDTIVQRVDPALKPRFYYRGGSLAWENVPGATIEVPDDYHGFYAVQFWHAPQVVPAGGSIGAPLRMEFYRGLNSVQAVGDGYVGEIDMTFETSRVLIRPRLATPGVLPTVGTTVAVSGPPGFTAVEQTFEPKTAVAPGVAREWEWTLRTRRWPRGDYVVTMRGPDGQQAAAAFRLKPAS